MPQSCSIPCPHWAGIIARPRARAAPGSLASPPWAIPDQGLQALEPHEVFGLVRELSSALSTSGVDKRPGRDRAGSRLWAFFDPRSQLLDPATDFRLVPELSSVLSTPAGDKCAGAGGGLRGASEGLAGLPCTALFSNEGPQLPDLKGLFWNVGELSSCLSTKCGDNLRAWMRF